MSSIIVTNLEYVLDNGRPIFNGVTFHIKPGQHVALIGPNGSGKTTLMNLLSGKQAAPQGAVALTAPFHHMDQFVGRCDEGLDVRSLMLMFSPAAIRESGTALAHAEAAIQEESSSEGSYLEYSQALANWEEVGGYQYEVLWDKCAIAAVGLPISEIERRAVTTLSGGEQKRLVLEMLFRSNVPILLLDEPDNFLDLEGKRWLEDQMNESRKTIFYVSHDRALIHSTASRIITLEEGEAWMHEGGFATYAEARVARFERIVNEQKSWHKKREQLAAEVARKRDWAKRSAKFATRYQAAKSQLERYDQSRPELVVPSEQNIRMKMAGFRSGQRALVMNELAMPRLFRAFSAEIDYGERVCLIGPNGTGKSHFVRVIQGEPLEYSGQYRLGYKVKTAYFSQLHQPPVDAEQVLVELLQQKESDLGKAMSHLKRYELDQQSQLRFENLSGGEQARFQLLNMELAGANFLILDEPTDNLDVASAEALERAIAAFDGTVMAVSHDRWFISHFQRFFVFEGDGTIKDSREPTYDLMTKPNQRQAARARGQEQ